MMGGMKQDSVDLRERRLRAIDAGLSQASRGLPPGWRRRQRHGRGRRVVGRAPRHHGPNTTLVVALSLDGITAAMDRLAFEVFGAEVLVLSLRPGQVVIWDNLSVHKRADAHRLIEARGCQLLWLPPSSPDFTPIEQANSKRKAALGRSGARTREALDAVITAGLVPITPTDAQGLVRPLRLPASVPSDTKSVQSLKVSNTWNPATESRVYRDIGPKAKSGNPD